MGEQSGGRVDWYGKDLIALVENASAELLDEAAALVLGQSRINIQTNGQIDTGFMWNSGYMVSAKNNTFLRAKAEASAHADRTMVSQLKPEEDGGSLVCFGAMYAIYQEILNSYLYRALQQKLSDINGKIRQVGKRYMK